MSHAVPTLPTPKRTGQPKRRYVPGEPILGLPVGDDLPSQARCTAGGLTCLGICPRHDPVDYSVFTAQHRTDLR